MKLYQIREHDDYSDYSGSYVDHCPNDSDRDAIFFSEDAAKTYCEERNRAATEARRERRYQQELEIHNRMVTSAREHNALVAAGMRQGAKTMEPARTPKRGDFPLKDFAKKHSPDFIYEELNTMDEPVL